MSFRRAVLVLTLLAVLVSSAAAGYSLGPDSVRIPVLMYHHLVPESTDIKGGPIITAELFEQQMEALKRAGFNTIDFRQLRDFMAEGKRLPLKPVLITFDDGYESNYVYAYPVLKRLSMKAAINVITSVVPPKTTPSFNPKVLTYLSWNQMREMADGGLIDFQSHTHDLHRFVPKAPGKEGYAAVTPLYDARTGNTETRDEYERRIREDFMASKRALEENLGLDVFVLTYPYGVFNDDTRRLAAEAGYVMQVTIGEGFNLRGGDVTQIRRIKVSQSMSPGQLVERISGR